MFPEEKLENHIQSPKGIFRQPKLSLSEPVQAFSANVDCDAAGLLFRHKDRSSQEKVPLLRRAAGRTKQMRLLKMFSSSHGLRNGKMRI